MENMEDEGLKLITKYFEEVVKPVFNIKSWNGGASTNHRGETELTFQMPGTFSFYKNTDYYFEPKGKKFIHYTSLDTFFKIINNGYFLATPLSWLDDPAELIFAGKKLEGVVSKDVLDKLKKNIFSLSMCDFTNGVESFDMWRLFGKNGNGVGIVFSFFDNHNDWLNDSFLSKVYYGKEGAGLSKFETLKEKHLAFLKNNSKDGKNKVLRGIGTEEGIPDSMALFMAFHKSSFYNVETEVRFLKSFLNEHEINGYNRSLELLVDNQNAVQYGYRIPILSKENIEKREKDVKLNELNREPGIGHVRRDFPPEATELKKMINGDPFIVIEKVILGYRFDESQAQHLKSTSASLINQRNGWLNKETGLPPFEFELSQLHKEFYGN